MIKDEWFKPKIQDIVKLQLIDILIISFTTQSSTHYTPIEVSIDSSSIHQ